ncbi:MAG: methyltransferase domain-containing protein, partial [Candidatus Adiutrix sp.]|nr:methyltransferase domain-containing protein [Candidatus Adiutrix sp.]
MNLDAATAAKLAASLTAETPDLLPYLPYLLQDLWVLGTPPESVESLVREHIPEPGSRRFLDLGCGKGAVAVRLAEAFGAEVVGVDLMPEFIAEARAKAEEFDVGGRCRFRVEDVNAAVERERDFDAVILGAVSGVSDSAAETVAKLLRTVKTGGWVIIDDAYLTSAEAQVRYVPQTTPTCDGWRTIFAACGAEVLADGVRGKVSPNKCSASRWLGIMREAHTLGL